MIMKILQDCSIISGYSEKCWLGEIASMSRIMESSDVENI